MKQREFRVWFSNCNYAPEFIRVLALNQNDALILAQAERVRRCEDYTLDHIELVKQPYNRRVKI